MTRLSTLMGVFALGAAAFFIYQAQQATARTAAPPAVDAMTAAAPKPAETATETTAETAENQTALYGTFTCTPDSFALTSTADGYQLKGLLETPTAGYGYTPRYIDETADSADMVLELRGPQGMVAQAIGNMEIDHMYVRDGSMQTMTVRIDKTFNWGPDTIVCKNVATTTPAPQENAEEAPAAPDSAAPVTE